MICDIRRCSFNSNSSGCNLNAFAARLAGCASNIAARTSSSGRRFVPIVTSRYVLIAVLSIDLFITYIANVRKFIPQKSEFLRSFEYFLLCCSFEELTPSCLGGSCTWLCCMSCTDQS